MLAFGLVPGLTFALLSFAGFRDPQAGIDGHPGLKGVGLPIFLAVWFVTIVYYAYVEFYIDRPEAKRAQTAGPPPTTVRTDQLGTLVAMIDPAAWPTIANQPHLRASLLSVVQSARDADEAYRLLEGALSREGLRDALIPPPR
jgi:hypothetical protein